MMNLIILLMGITGFSLSVFAVMEYIPKRDFNNLIMKVTEIQKAQDKRYDDIIKRL